jgi:hypothetical protein
VKVARPGSSKQGLPVCICNRAPLTYAYAKLSRCFFSFLPNRTCFLLALEGGVVTGDFSGLTGGESLGFDEFLLACLDKNGAFYSFLPSIKNYDSAS